MNTLDIHEVLKYLPHRYPFLLIDRVLVFTKDESLTAIKNVTINEPFFQGHFPNRPVMPGVLMIEAMAQACAILSFKSMDTLPSKNSIFYFVGIDKARFKRPVEPGDQLVINVSTKRQMKGIWQFETNARVGDELCCTAELMCTYKEI
ncbi:MAG: 3-hydroxyacyl-ACP dehydratase FabZ [Gammaproteobacteria bacterium]|nr:3-hydroxyacyl-ACP dehydratase FabZ [Gammaproteobacteria bacterium]MDH3371009.1 3-hydroxyacyl-ACP dehydratase FabZ [Gammaproteobacteria bacterium]MDH3405445.1 3-hydroxyacyl-ACP dehydratase FabZ [Gammaproteobacteria bacterium]MDH3562942.1 3-hydroxyacyl-ACP dehydratase FabZ [Gammaproteobacteria bacterium]MDH5486065.1 3-hydroxyacyl-ACP dehydratase FabZ [Gammaproteobacteria bacterium]